MTRVRAVSLRGMVLTVGLCAWVACRGAAPTDPMLITAPQLSALVDSMMPGVAASALLQFKWTPKSQVRSIDELHRYLLDKLAKELPPERAEGLTGAYRLLGMIPDTLNLASLFEKIYGEQIAGYYDPDSSSLYFVPRGERTQLRFLLAHELTHALQHQYMPLDSIMKDRDNADRASAAQAVLEGHAQMVAYLTMLPGQDLLHDESFLTTAETNIREAQNSQPIFSTAPLVVREGLIGPYLRGTEFVRWFRMHFPEEQPFGARMPVSTEQILHPTRYEHGDVPVRIEFLASAGEVIHEDTFGELEITVLRSVLAGINEVPTDVAMEWGGDRYRVFKTPDGPALVWYSAWDTQGGAKRFHQTIGSQLLQASRTGYRTTVEDVRLGGHPAVRVVVAPTGWSGWKAMPEAEAKN